MELTIPAAAGASQPEEAGPESTMFTAGTTHSLCVCGWVGCTVSCQGNFLSQISDWKFLEVFIDTKFKNGSYVCSMCIEVSDIFLSVSMSKVFVSGTKVLACWTDCRFYPAKILSVNRDGEARVHLLHLMFCCCYVTHRDDSD